MTGGGGLAVHKRFFLQKVQFFKKTFRIIHILSKRALHIVWAVCYIQIVVEVTMNMAKYTSSWQSAAGAAKECQYLNQL